jgi:hypothetical protein
LNRYSKNKYSHDGMNFGREIPIIANSFPEGTLINLNIEEHGSETYIHHITTLTYKVRKYDYLIDYLVRVSESISYAYNYTNNENPI